MAVTVEFSLAFHGNAADENLLDFYDAADALTGFQRSLALTAHLVLNGDVITQAPHMKGALLQIKSPEAGSWKVVAYLTMITSGVHFLGTASKDTVYGHLAASLYSYVVHESLGFHVDFDKTLGEQYEEIQKDPETPVPKVSQSQADALIEKVEGSLKEMHRPIYASQSATYGRLTTNFADGPDDIADLDLETYEYVKFTRALDKPVDLLGRISSYNINSYTGRIFLPELGRTIPFELSDFARDIGSVMLVTRSLTLNARDRMTGEGEVGFTAIRYESNSGRLKRIMVLRVYPPNY